MHRSADGRPRLGHSPQRLFPRPRWRERIRDRGCRPHTSPAVQYLSSLSQRRPLGGAVCRWDADRGLATMMPMPTREQIEDALRRSSTPSSARTSSRWAWCARSSSPSDGRVDVVVSLTTAGCPIRNHFQNAVAEKVRASGVDHVNVELRRALRPGEAVALAAARPRRRSAPGRAGQVKNVICVGSGKGGVGKSTVTANLAAALQADGQQAAALDADVWGYSIPRMLGVHGRPKVSAERKILPLDGPAGVRAISIEHFLNERDQAITWRGPMLHKAIRQFLEDVDWGELDYLLIDLPPGTGDVSMTLAQLLPQARFVIVTTPQPAAQKVAARAADTARRFDLEIARRDREHVRLHHPRRRALHDLRRGRRPAARRRARRAAARQDPAPGGAARARRRGPPARARRAGRSRPPRRSTTRPRHPGGDARSGAVPGAERARRCRPSPARRCRWPTAGGRQAPRCRWRPAADGSSRPACSNPR